MIYSVLAGHQHNAFSVGEGAGSTSTHNSRIQIQDKKLRGDIPNGDCNIIPPRTFLKPILSIVLFPLPKVGGNKESRAADHGWPGREDVLQQYALLTFHSIVYECPIRLLHR